LVFADELFLSSGLLVIEAFEKGLLRSEGQVQSDIAIILETYK
jgi:hypothetical protein